MLIKEQLCLFSSYVNMHSMTDVSVQYNMTALGKRRVLVDMSVPSMAAPCWLAANL
jgi:hypothetical protein